MAKITFGEKQIEIKNKLFMWPILILGLILPSNIETNSNDAFKYIWLLRVLLYNAIITLLIVKYFK